MRNIVYILLLLSSFSFAQNEQLFDKANTLYNSEKYTEAIQAYNQILSTKQHSASLYFNKANAHYKLNQIAESVYYYEKALQLDPSNKDIKTNLGFANNMRIDKIDVIPSTGFSKLFSSFINMLSFDTWAIVAIVCMLIFVAAFVRYVIVKYAKQKRMFFVISFIALFFSITAVTFAYKQEANVKANIFAIVFAKESRVKTEPKFNSDEAFLLHEGTKVKVLESFKGWTKIRLTNGSEGWIVNDDIKKL